MSGPLTGIRVVDMTTMLSGPWAAMILADQGADVIKVERPGVGDFARAYDTRVNGLASHFVWTNRSKESLALDLKHAAATEVLARLLEGADVLVQNLAPGAAARMGLDHASLAPVNPRIVVCDISGYGDGGPYTEKKAYDLLIQSEAGFVSITGTPETPAKAGNSMADIAAGMYAYTNILAALMHRQQTGEGQRIDVSMLESLTEWMSYPLYYAFDGAPPPPRTGASHATIYPYGPFAAGDGKTVMLGLQNEREWMQFCEVVMQNKTLATDPRFNSNSLRHENKSQLEPIILKEFSTLGAAQVIERLDQAQIANARMNNMADLWTHPQLKARERWLEVDTPNGKLPALLPPGQSDAFDYTMGAIPSVGEHTQQILAELGITWSKPSTP